MVRRSLRSGGHDMNNSSTGGYVLPSATQGLPGNLTLDQFIQTVLVGISGLDGTLVRPKWQIAPPKQPELTTDWLAFGVALITPDANAYVGMDSAGNSTFQRHEGLEIPLSFYGPNAMQKASEIRDGFQIQQNLEALRAANMGFAYVNEARHIPERIHERYVNRVEMSVFLRREVQRTYPILSFLSADGVIHTVLGSEEYLLEWQSKPEET